MSQKTKYNPSKGGHAPGHLRDALLAALSRHWDDLEEGPWFRHLDMKFFSIGEQTRWDSWTPTERAIWLTGQLWNCHDILPGSVCALASLSQGSTYAQLVRQLRSQINASSGSFEADSAGPGDIPA
jgi:hypothetical protein